jgi:hypothetical protein
MRDIRKRDKAALFHPILTLLLSSVIFLTVFSSCEYKAGTAIPKNFRTVYVHKVVNDTQELDIADLLTDSVRDEFNLDGRLIPIEDYEKADALLAMKINKFIRTIDTTTPDKIPDRIYLAMEVKMVLQNVSTKNILNSKLFEEKTNFNMVSQPVSTELDIKKTMLQRLARKILLCCIDGFY